MIQLLALAYFLSGQPSTPAVRQLSESVLKNCRREFHKLAILIAFKESSFDPNTRTEQGDIGIMQINNIHNLSEKDRLNISSSVKFACSLLDKHYKHRHNDKMWFGRYHSKTKSLKIKYYKSIWKLYTKGHYE